MVIQSVSTYETSSKSTSFTFAPAIPIVGQTIIKLQNQMKVLEEIKVSVYENVYSKKPKIMSFLEVIFMCIHPVYASIIQSIRRYHQEGDHEAAQKLKSQLPCFTPAGTFDGAHAIRNFQLPSHIIGLDYDHVPNRLEIIRLCAADPHTVAALESPTDGVKIFAYVEGIEGRHREGQLLVSRYYDQLTGLTSDPACKDESRLCYFTYSPDGYVASLYQSFVLEAAVETQPFQPTAENLPSPPLPAKASETSENFSEEEVSLFLSSYIFLNPLTAGQRHTNLFKLACEACRRRYSQESILRGITVYFEHSDFPAQEIRSILQSGYQKVTSTPSVSASPLCSSLHKDKMTKVTYSPSENVYEADEAYWQGEEFRKETPCFPKSVYKYLPDLLNECILEEEGDREQDLSFLSNLTALSSVLPATFGIYNHKKYSPHFYSFGIAPAGSNKSIAQTGRYLLEEVHDWILSNSELQQKTYNHKYTQWKLDCTYKKKAHEECPEEPEKPAYKMLFLPATTSYSRMQIQMRDNGPQGSIIFDTEAQTLATANHLDCGNFDDMLRKAFEHENIDSAFKINGLTPIYIRFPMLAMFLTGTPSQMASLIETSEKGLPSRIMLYTFRSIPKWKPMGDDSISLEESFKPLAHRVFELYHFCKNHPVLFHFSRSQWDYLNHTFSKLLAEVVLEGNDDLQAVVKRYACLVMRISMIQARIRQFEANDGAPDIYCEDVDFDRSLQIVLCCYEHSRLLLSSMPSSQLHPLKDPNSTRKFISELPETFTTEDAMQIGVKNDFSRRKISRLIKSFIGVKINKISHGKYQKIS